MYDTVSTLLFDGTGGVLGTLTSEVGDMFTSAIPVVIPVVGAIAIGFFAIGIVRALLHV